MPAGPGFLLGSTGWGTLGPCAEASVPEGPPGDPPGLLDRLRAGDGRAFEELVIQYQHRVFGVALRMLGNAAEAEEVAQEAFVRAYRGIGEFRGDASLATWLYAITSRLALNRLGAGERRVTRQGDEALAFVADGRSGPAETAEQSELALALQRAIAELPDERRAAIVLRDIEGLAYEEIARALDLPIGTVRSRIHRARMDLKAKLERFFP
jgi:RNA polymerase sigma-70 factor (ECF subfamily)